MVRSALLNISNGAAGVCWLHLDKIEFEEESEVAKKIHAWRQSERKIMIDTIQDLIQTSHKYAKSQYTPSALRARWTKLAGQLIWYNDQIMKSFSLEALTIQLQDLEKKVGEQQEERERQIASRNYPTLVFPKPEERRGEERRAQGAEKAQNMETSQAVKADDLRVPRKSPRKRLRLQLDD